MRRQAEDMENLVHLVLLALTSVASFPWSAMQKAPRIIYMMQPLTS
jgi:hypothetical protein